MGEQRLERVLPERFELGVHTPVIGEERVAGVAAVHGEGDAVVVHLLPERRERRIAERAPPTVAAEDRRRTHVHDPHVAFDHPVELIERPIGVGEGHIARGDDAVLVSETPVVVEPFVEAVEGGERRVEIALERRLHADAERREHEARLQPLLIHHRDACVAVAILGGDRHQLAERLPHVGLGDLAAEVVVETAGPGDGVEGRVRDEPVDPPADEEALAPVDLRPLHAPLVHLGVDVADEGVFGLVVVVVGVEGSERKRAHPSIVGAVFIAPRIASRAASKWAVSLRVASEAFPSPTLNRQMAAYSS